jgi:hypothetical protein
MSISDEEMRTYLVQTGKGGLKTLGLIEKLRPFVEMMQTDLGSAMLKEDVEQHAALINSIYNKLIDTGEVSQREVITLQLLHNRLQTVYDRLRVYYEGIKAVKGIKNG